MKLKIKTKIVNGKPMMGIIDESLSEIAPFEFAKITEVKESEFSSSNYYICEKENGDSSLYDYNGVCRVDYKDGYKDLNILKYSFSQGFLDIAAKKDDQLGIIRAGYKWDKGYNNKTPYLEVAYDFGKCDEIIEENENNVRIIKHLKSGDRVGYYYHKHIDGLVEPKYLSYNYKTVGLDSGPNLYTFKDESGHKRHDSYSKSDYITYDKLTFNTEIIEYSKLKNKKKVFGIKQKVDDDNRKYETRFVFKDFLPADYSKIEYDKERNLFLLEKTENGEVKKGFVGATFRWHFGGQGAWIWGYPNLEIVVDVPCEYDDIQIVDDNHAIVKKDGKYGIIYFAYNYSCGDWTYDNSSRSSNERCYNQTPIKYDSITKLDNAFVGTINDEKTLITNYMDNDTKEATTISNNYKNIKQLNKELYLCDLDNNKKEIVVIQREYRPYYLPAKYVIEKISPCDDAEIIDKNESSLIKVTNNGVIYLYYASYGEIEKISSNVKDIAFDNKNKLLIITKEDGNIEYIRYNKVIFSTENISKDSDNISVSYMSSIDKFKLTDDTSIKIYPSNDKKSITDIYLNRSFINFDAKHFENGRLYVFYTENEDGEPVSTLARFKDEKEIKIAKGNFEVENIVYGGKRIIISKIDPDTNQKKYGIIEADKGNVCAECEYDYITFDDKNLFFICKTGDAELLLDVDGFFNSENQNITKRTPTTHILKFKLQEKTENNQ